jgi:phage terminase large subunit-like protein
MLLPDDLLQKLNPAFVSSLPAEQQEEILSLLEEWSSLREKTKIRRMYPETGPLRRELYRKHLEFFRAGRVHTERAAIAANRTGKTWGIGGYETTLHLTGEYPDWWEGRRFDRPTDIWVAGDTSETTRDIVQVTLMGELGMLGTGLVPADRIIGEPTKRSGVPGAMDMALIRHASGGHSRVGFKSYDQGRRKFQGTARDVIWLDEEPPAEVYDECLVRLMTRNGIMICTFTPLLGLSEVVLRYMPALAPAEATRAA